MAVAMQTNGLHHAVSLGTIEVSSKPAYSSQFDRSYDSEDENMSRRRLRHTLATDLYPRTSVYSKGDIREQYCLTDRQLNTIDRPRRDGFFGCLSRRGAPQSFLGVCVGRRAPSDENLAAYAPFYKYPRYQHKYGQNDKSPESDADSSYFRRQPASILSTSKMTDAGVGTRCNWMGLQTTANNENAGFSNNESSYHYPAYATHTQTGQTTPRTKHVSFARSHTLTSFDDVNLGFRSSERLKAARSQERLIGGKKTIMATSSMYESTQMPQTMATQQPMVGGVPMHHALIQQHPHMHTHPHAHMHGHSHQHHHGPIHIHQLVPAYSTDLGQQVHIEQPISLLTNRGLVDDITVMGMGMMACPAQAIVQPNPEIVVVEKKFRNAMKTQATQTELRKDGCTQVLALSPRTLHKVKVVSQGAQTNGLQNGKKLTKSLSEIPNGQIVNNNRSTAANEKEREMLEHQLLHRTQSEDPTRSPEESFDLDMNNDQIDINYYKPPPPLEISQYIIHQGNNRRSIHLPTQESAHYMPNHDETAEFAQRITMGVHKISNSCANNSTNLEDSYAISAFDYESNSLPRRACSYHRVESDLYSNSLPRRDPLHSHEICKHITECSELMGDMNVVDFTRPYLLPPPRQYCKDDTEEEQAPLEEQPSIQYLHTERNRRKSMVVNLPQQSDTPFRRDDVRRQSMPVYVKPEKMGDSYTLRSSLKGPSGIITSTPEEKEIFIDFKPHVITPRPSPTTQRYRTYSKTGSESGIPHGNQDDWVSSTSTSGAVMSAVESEEEDEEDIRTEGDPLYENIPSVLLLSECSVSGNAKKNQFRKRSVSLDDSVEIEEKIKGISTPPSPCRDELLANTSTYPSSDSLANDATRDHSDGIWNESQVTVLTAEQKDNSEESHNSNLLLTPSTRRKNLILQHQQRSSIDTDAIDFEDQYVDHSPTYGNAPLTKTFKASPTPLPQQKTALTVPTNIITPSIAVTPTLSSGVEQQEEATSSSSKSPNTSRRPSRNLNMSPIELRKKDVGLPQSLTQKNSDAPTALFGRAETFKVNITNTDVSECSTNTDEYATCTDTSKRTQGIKTPPTITSSSSTTQVPVSTQSSQMDKSHCGSSFESASSLYSTRGEVLSEDNLLHDEKSLKLRTETIANKHSPAGLDDLKKTSPTHSISSTSSGSYNMTGLPIVSAKNTDKKIPHSLAKPSATMPPSAITQQREKTKLKSESVSDDERSEIRYSSSGYYESPHDEDHTSTKTRRYRVEEDRKRKKISMKLDIEKENMRALTSPIKKPQPPTVISKENSPEKQATSSLADTTSPNKIKRFRPKIRRQFRRTSRDDSSLPRRPKNVVNMYAPLAPESTEKLLDCTIMGKPEERPVVVRVEPKVKVVTTATTVKSASEGAQLKAKSVESLRSVSPGSDSVFYSEADGAGVDQHGHCLHCGKEVEGQNSVGSALGGDSVESIPFIENENEQDIVKPPSDFADSPVTTKTTQRLYKKMDKRFRSEEKYHGERGRLYKTRQENIRAKSEERSRESSTRSPHTLRPAGSSPCVLPDASSEQNQQIIYRGHYDPSRYTRLTDADVWTQLDHQSFDRPRGDRRSSTDSERSFSSKYQVILHRLVQRRCTLEMYHRQKNNSFGVDKTVVVKSDSGEFGFRIHGSKPVVVAAIEPDTPAESSGLEVGDIIISVNGVQVLDKHHTEVVKIAHDGCETLELKVARTIGVLMNEQQDSPSQPIYSGYLWRQSGQAKGSPNAKKWVRRWFCLRPDDCLYYYKTEDDSQPVGAMIMAKHTIEHCPPEIGKPFAFKIDSGEGIPLYVAADSEELTNRWINVLKQSILQDSPWLDKCARNLYQQPNSIIRPDCFGYLLKLGSRWCGWSKRYCVLKDACLYFYQDVNSKTAFGMACLHGYKVSSMPTSASGKKNSFEIIPPEVKLRHYYFCTESEMDKKRWVSALEYSIDRWIKSG